MYAFFGDVFWVCTFLCSSVLSFFFCFCFLMCVFFFFFFFSSRRRHTRSLCDWSSDVCSSDLVPGAAAPHGGHGDQLRAGEIHGLLRLHQGGRGVRRPRARPLDLGGEDQDRSEERRVGKECRSRWATYA